MKNPMREIFRGEVIQTQCLCVSLIVWLLTMLLTGQAHGQAPTLLWTTNIGATLFAVDAQTNLYANAGGTVIKLNATGVPLQTNTICPLPGMAQRDAAGNYYFAGNFDGTQNFGGITLVGGWTNWPTAGRWTPGYPTHFVAKYDSGGVLQWVNSFGSQAATGNMLTDILVDSTGAVYAGHLGIGTPMITRLSNTSAVLWSQAVSGGYANAVKLGGLTASNCVFIMRMSDNDLIPKRIFTNGATSNVVPSWGLLGTTVDSTNTKPVMDNLGRVVLAGQCYFSEAGCSGSRYLRKYALDGSFAWSVTTSSEEQWTLARDNIENIYLGTAGGRLIQYDANGNQIWSANYYQTNVVGMLVDLSGNRFVRLASGAIARLGPDAPAISPAIVNDPQTQIVRLGSNVTFSVGATGSPTLLYYRWRKDGVNLGVASTTNYTIAGVTTNSAGNYDVVVTNLYGSITSAPAALIVAPSFLTPFTGAVGLWGQQATLSVSAWGSGALTYQWYKAGQQIGGATNSTLVFPNVQINDGGAYSVVVTSPYGSVTNTPADLVVNPANISIGLYAGVTIQGTVGYTYGIEYATNLQNAVWNSLTNVTLTQPVEIWVDTSVNVLNPPKRFYRVTSQ